MTGELDLDSIGMELDSGEERNKLAPDTFPIPSRDARENLEVGDEVKLIFRDLNDPEDNIVERMWVLVESRGDDGTYTGTLDNDPFEMQYIEAGDLVRFGPEHVIDIDCTEYEPIMGSHKRWGFSALRRRIAQVLARG